MSAPPDLGSLAAAGVRGAGRSDAGLKRSDNQDRWVFEPAVYEDATGVQRMAGVCAVVDGVGGYLGGGEAAETARDKLSERLRRPTPPFGSLVEEAVVHANNAVAERRAADPHRGRMSCVLTVAFVDPAQRRAWYGHVGDTRLYLFRDGALDKVTRDHSFVGLREDSRQIDETAAMRHPRRNEILRDVGSARRALGDPEFADVGHVDLTDGDVLLLCSDGLTDLVPSWDVRDILAAAGRDLDAAADRLVAAALHAGGTDNVTVLLVSLDAPTPQAARWETGDRAAPADVSHTMGAAQFDALRQPRGEPPAAPSSSDGATRHLPAPPAAPTPSPSDAEKRPRARRSVVAAAILGGLALAALALILLGRTGALPFIGNEEPVPGPPGESDDAPPALDAPAESVPDGAPQTAPLADALAAGGVVRLDSTIRYTGPVALASDIVVEGDGATWALPDSVAAAVTLGPGARRVELRNLRVEGAALGAIVRVRGGAGAVVLRGVEAGVPLVVVDEAGGPLRIEIDAADRPDANRPNAGSQPDDEAAPGAERP